MSNKKHKPFFGIGRRFDNIGHMNDVAGNYIDTIATSRIFGIRSILDDKNTFDIVWYITAVIVMSQKMHIQYYRGLIDGMLILSKQKYERSYESLFYKYADEVLNAEKKRREWK